VMNKSGLLPGCGKGGGRDEFSYLKVRDGRRVANRKNTVFFGCGVPDQTWLSLFSER
jgi:hypothetical protein